MTENDEILINAPERALRFKGADFYTPGARVLVLGAGGIGSHVGYLLAKQDCEIHIFDDDTVEPHNLGGQLYDELLIGLPKVEAFLAMVVNIDSKIKGNVHIYKEKYTQDSIEDLTVFSCFDNMAARKLAYEKWKSLDHPDKLFIDGRMLADQGMVYCVRPGKEAAYEETLFEDSEVEEGPCSNRATSFCAFFTSSVMVANFNNHLANLKHGFELKPVSFKTRYVLSMGLIEITDEPTTNIPVES